MLGTRPVSAIFAAVAPSATSLGVSRLTALPIVQACFAVRTDGGSMSVDFQTLAIAFVSGIVLGAAYLTVLWGAVRGLADARHPLARLVGGAALRVGLFVGLLAALFYLAMDGRWERLLACLAGFLATRSAVTRWASRRAAPGPTR